MNQLLDLAKIISTFNMITGELIQYYYEFDREAVAGVQARLVALKTKYSRDFNAFAPINTDELNAKIAESEITAEQLEDARALVDSEDKGGVLKDVPPLGEIATRLKLVDMRAKDLLMQVQAVARTYTAITSTEYGATNDSLSLRELVYDLRAEPNAGQPGVEPKFTRGFIGFKSPASLTAAQALHHYADVVCRVMQVESVANVDTLNSLRALMVVSLNSANEISSNDGVGTKELTRDIRDLYNAQQHHLKFTQGIDLSNPEVVLAQVNKLSESVDKMLSDIAEKKPEIGGANIDDIRALLDLREQQIGTRGIGTRSFAISLS